MKYININANVVTEIIPEIDSRFPSVPFKNRFALDFVKKCIPVDDDFVVSVGMVYKDGIFTPPEPIIVPAPPYIPPISTDDILIALADLDAQREVDKLETQLAITELAEMITGGVSNG